MTLHDVGVLAFLAMLLPFAAAVIYAEWQWREDKRRRRRAARYDRRHPSTYRWEDTP